MQGSGAYDDASEYQRQTAASDETRLRDAVAQVPMPGGAFTIVDYGAAEGRNSIHSVRTAVEAVRARDAKAPVACIHNDLLTNDWNGLFANVASSTESYLTLDPRPVSMAAAGSFFDVVVPPDSVQLGVSFSAAHWLREQPHVDMPGGIYFCEATGNARDTLRARAAADWQRFLECRATELAAGGRLVVGCVGTQVETDGTEHVTARELLQLMAAVADDLATAGRITAEAVRAYVFPVYARSVAEATAPVTGDGAPLVDRFTVEVAETHAVANPYLDQYRQDGDAAKYAHDYVAFVRAFSSSAIRDGLLAPGSTGEDADVLVDAFYDGMEQRVKADPATGVFEDWTLSVVLARR
jgi:SAM dependent carboxyl methyltransferase